MIRILAPLRLAVEGLGANPEDDDRCSSILTQSVQHGLVLLRETGGIEGGAPLG